jgi:hypothetical protein
MIVQLQQQAQDIESLKEWLGWFKTQSRLSYEKNADDPDSDDEGSDGVLLTAVMPRTWLFS